jgi:DNA-binding transcriptional LysR family regulator
MRIELRHLRYFVAVAEDLHFGRAAERLCISQPPLSQQILALEEAVGARLLERSNRRVELTEAGRIFLEEARVALAQVQRAAELAARAERGELGELKVGFFASAPFIPVAQRLFYAFRQARPRVHLVLQETPTLQQVDAIMERRLTVGLIRPLAQVPEAFSTRELYREELVVAMREDHSFAASSADARIRIEDLAQESFVLYPRAIGTGLYDQTVALCRDAGFAPRISQEASATPTIMGLVAAGLGIALLPASLQRIRMEGVTFRRLAAPPSTALWLAWRRDERSPLVRAFLDVAEGLSESAQA